MKTDELFLKTMFCCMSCDGDIDPSEVDLLRQYVKDSTLFVNLNADGLINQWIEDINARGGAFLTDFIINQLAKSGLSMEDETQLINLSMEMIEADDIIKYSEVSFFKHMRKHWHCSDDRIMDILQQRAKLPNSPIKNFPLEEFLLPDNDDSELVNWDSISFEQINIGRDK